jgi:RNA polymerase sigma factor (sigma-70 family)
MEDTDESLRRIELADGSAGDELDVSRAAIRRPIDAADEQLEARRAAIDRPSDAVADDASRSVADDARDADLPRSTRRVTRSEWRALIERHAPRLRTFVRLQAGPALRAREPVDDLVQSIVRELLTDGGEFEFDGESAFKSYMYTVARNKIVSKQRYHEAAMRRCDRAVPLSDAAWDLPERDRGSLDGSPSRCAERGEDIERLRASIAALDEEDRRILFMRRVFEIQTAEIARELGIAESTVRWRLSSVMTRLASEMG